MDIISFNEASTANGRIESFIENPDSTSGVVTVPSTIASGETVTIPAGRTAILPDVQIDGTLNVQGKVFIPSGSKLSTVVEKVTSTDNAIVRFDGTTGSVQDSSILIDDNGNLNITGTGARITGDFSNATHANRLSIQTNVLNGNTIPFIIPNGTGTSSSLVVGTSQDASNGSYLAMNANSLGTARLISSYTGIGSYLPLIFEVGGADRMRIDTSGNVLVTGSGGIGYGTGSGGTVTQLTSKSTAVTLNKPSGQITTNNAALAAGAGVTFLLKNSLITQSDTVLLSPKGTVNYDVKIIDIYGGAANIMLINTNSLTHSDAISINFSIIKGAIS